VLRLAVESHVDRSIEGPGAFIESNVSSTHIGFALVPLTEREKLKPPAGQACVGVAAVIGWAVAEAGVTATEALPPSQVPVPPSARSLRVRLWLMLPRKDPGNPLTL
jgi:hypothetical protein